MMWLPKKAIRFLSWDQKLFKEGCEFLGYAMHKRAAAWWAYCCVLSLQEELKINPFKPRDIEDIGKPKPFEIPEWAKVLNLKDLLSLMR